MKRRSFVLIPLFLKSQVLKNKPNQYDFSFSLKTVMESHAEKYVVEKKNIRRFREAFFPFCSYWGSDLNDEACLLTFHFPFDREIIFARLIANLYCANFELNKKVGSGKGSASLWYSINGKDWFLIIEQAHPTEMSFKGCNTNTAFDQRIVGSNSLWLQVRLFSTGAKDRTYSVAQFCRNQIPSDINSVCFDLRVKLKKG